MRSLGLSLLLLLLMAPAWAVGHSSFVQSEPASGERVAEAPGTVRVVFAAPVETAGLAASVLAPDGAELARAVDRTADDPQAIEIALDPGMATGSYQVRWRVLSTDGHVTHGLQRFRVGGEDPTVLMEEDSSGGSVHVLGRALSLLGPILLVGLVAVRITVARGIASPSASAMWWWAWVLGVALWAVGLALVVVEMAGAFRTDPFGGFPTAADPGIRELLVDTRWGNAVVVQVVALVAAYVAERVARRAAPEPWSRTPALWALAAPPAIALLALSWSGHASTGGDAAVGIVVDGAHNIATGAWVGGLLGLFVLVLLPGRALADKKRISVVAPVVVRFSALAIGAVTVLVVTGVYRALAELNALSDLVDTGYGRALAVKLAVFALLLAVGAYNRFVAHPRLERAHLGLTDDDQGAARRLLATVQLELILAVALIAVVGVLISLPPPA